MAYAPKPLNSTQFALFPEDHPAMRTRTEAEFSPAEFAEKPGALHHGTFADKMPTESTGTYSAGIHLGTLESARQRLNSMGPRDRTRDPAVNSKGYDPAAPAQIHVRRLSDSANMSNTPENPTWDRGNQWDESETGQDRHAHLHGEYYKNDVEDAGSISVRVPHGGYLTSHEDAVKRAQENGLPVHPMAAGLIRDFGGKGLDTPIEHQPSKETGFKTEGSRDRWADEPIRHDTLLPYKLRGNPAAARSNVNGMPSERIAGGPNMFIGKNGVGTNQRGPAITFAATREEADRMTGDSGEPRSEAFGKGIPKWKRNWDEGAPF